MNKQIDRATVKGKAKEIFFDENNRLKLIFGGIIPMLVFTATLLVLIGLVDGSVTLLINYGVLTSEYDYSYFIVYLIILFALLPSLWGHILMIKRAFFGKEYALSDIFIFYRSPLSFIRALFASFFALSPVILIGVGGYFMFYANNELYYYLISIMEYEIIPDIVKGCLVVVMIVALLIFAILSIRFLPYVALCADEKLKILSSIPKVFAISRKRKKEGIKFVLSFWGHIALSALSFGVIYILYTLPYMTLSYVGYVNEMQEKENVVIENQADLIQQKDID